MARWVLIIVLIGVVLGVGGGLFDNAGIASLPHMQDPREVLRPAERIAIDGLAGLIWWVQHHGAPPGMTVAGKPVQIDTGSDFSLTHGCSLTGDEVNAILRA